MVLLCIIFSISQVALASEYIYPIILARIHKDKCINKPQKGASTATHKSHVQMWNKASPHHSIPISSRTTISLPISSLASFHFNFIFLLFAFLFIFLVFVFNGNQHSMIKILIRFWNFWAAVFRVNQPKQRTDFNPLSAHT